MATIVVVNAGSTSIKYALFEGETRTLFVQYDKVTEGCKRTVNNKKTMEPSALFDATVEDMLKILEDKHIDGYGFRVVHGGHELTKPIILDSKAIQAIEEAAILAPLHNYACLSLIKAWREAQPHALLYGIFDTAFHSTIPAYAATYDIPERFREKYHIKRYGFHGISCQSVLGQLKNTLGALPSRVVICHLGGGCSITAVKDGKSMDTSMGFSPLEGLMMASRTGDIDSGAVFMMEKDLREEGFSLADAGKEVQRLLQKEGGLKAIAGTDSMLEVLKRCEDGDPKASLALDMFVYHIKKYIGAYGAILGGIDAIAFTGGIGYGSEKVRKLSTMPFSGVPIFAFLPKEEEEIVRQGNKFF